MTDKVRRILIRQSETREALNTLAASENPDEAKLKEHRDALTGIETELREALEDDANTATGQTTETAESIDSETRERRELRSRSRLSRYLAAILNGEALTDGAEAEYRDACECRPGQIPVSMVFGGVPEHRAAATVAAGAVAETPMPTAGQVFVSPLARALGIMTPTVPAGVAAFPYISTGVSPATVAAGSDIGDSSPAIAAHTAEPGRVAATFKFRREDAAKLADLEDSLSANMREALANEFDAQVVRGDNAGSNLNGLLKQRAPTAPADNVVTTFATLVDSVKGFVDGTHAESFEQVRLVTSPTVSSFLTALLLNAGNRQDSALDWLRQTYTGGYRISGQAPTITQVDHATGGDRRAGGGGLWAVRTRVPSLAYAPIWSGMDVIRDEITGAKAGEVTLTAYMLVGGVALVRPDAYDVALVKTVAGVAP